MGWLANQILIRKCFAHIDMLQQRRSPRILPRSVSARLVERYIFNFRMRPSNLAERLPVSWLRPQVINGWAVVSFCILKIQRLTIRPIPSAIGFDSICCAYRCGVIDTSGDLPTPSVYIVGRNTDRRLISLVAPGIFESAMSCISANMVDLGECKRIHVRLADGRPLFSAGVFSTKANHKLNSIVFGSLSEFVNFIKDGVTSYAKSTSPSQYSRIDLQKEDAGYESMEANIKFNKIEYDWDGADLEFDSVVKAGGGGLYVWTFQGKAPACPRRVTKELMA